MGEVRNACEILIPKREGKATVVDRRRWVDSTKSK